MHEEIIICLRKTNKTITVYLTKEDKKKYSIELNLKYKNYI